MKKPVRFTPYSQGKFIFLREHGFDLREADVTQTVLQPDHVARARKGRWIAQRILSEHHVLRVVYEETPQERVVVTFYPARRSRYEPTHEL